MLRDCERQESRRERSWYGAGEVLTTARPRRVSGERRRHMGALLVASMTMLVVLSGCGRRPMPSVQADPSAVGCRAAFAALGPGAHNISELYPAVRQCTSLAMWIEAFEASEAGFEHPAVDVLRQVCRESAVAHEPLCSLTDS